MSESKLILEPLTELPVSFGKGSGEKWYRLKQAPDYAVSSQGRAGRLTAGRRGVKPGLLQPRIKFVWRKGEKVKGPRLVGVVSYRFYANGKSTDKNLANLLQAIRRLDTPAKSKAANTPKALPTAPISEWSWCERELREALRVYTDTAAPTYEECEAAYLAFVEVKHQSWGERLPDFVVRRAFDEWASQRGLKKPSESVLSSNVGNDLQAERLHP